MEQVSHRKIDTLLARYTESHRNPVNEVIHVVCVPAIVFSVFGLLRAIHPLAALMVCAVCIAYYCLLSLPFAIGMLMMSSAMLFVWTLLPQSHVLSISLGIFVIAWIGQFIGHKIEGKKPSFFEDLRFLLIGPLFVLGFLYRRLRIGY